jgi:hypothetical protein
MGFPVDLQLTQTVQRAIQQELLWDGATLNCINTPMMTVLIQAFGTTLFFFLTRLVDNLYPLHAHQTLNALTFNQAQGSKVIIMNFCRSLGYTSTPTGDNVLRLLKDL